MTPERFHGLPGWQQRLGKLAVAGVTAFLIAILVNVLEASFGSTGNPSILTFDGSAYLAFLVVGLIYVPEWGKVPLIGKIAIPLAAVSRSRSPSRTGRATCSRSRSSARSRRSRPAS